MNPYIRPVEPGDMEFVAEHMRIEDIEEVGALGLPPYDAVIHSTAVSPIVYTLLQPDQIPCAIVGVATSSTYINWGTIWLLGTKGIEDHAVTFLRQSKPALDRLFNESGHDVLYNYTYVNNTVHHKWLRWLGFKFIRKVTLPPFDKEFYEFVRIKD